MLSVGLVDDKSRSLYDGFLTSYAREVESDNLLLIGLQDEELAIGALAGQVRGEAFYIMSLYVAPSYRRMGGATMLLEALVKVTQGLGVSIRTEVIDVSDESKTMIAFLRYIGFKQDTEDKTGIYVTSLEYVARDEIFTNPSHEKLLKDVYLMKDMEPRLLEKTEMMAKELGAPIPEVGFFGEGVDSSASAFYYRNNEVKGYAIMDDSVNGYPTLSSIWSDGSPSVLVGLFRKISEEVKQKYPKDTLVAFFPVNDMSVRILMRLIPAAENITYRFSLFE